MPKPKPSAAFEMFNVIGRDWPLDPRHVLRISKRLNLIDCVPILLRCKSEGEVLAGLSLAGSLIVSNAVTNRWRGVVAILDYVGRIDEVFGNKDVAHWATAQKWRFSQKFGFPFEWRPKIHTALDGPFFERHVDKKLKKQLAEIEKKHPDQDVATPTRSWRQRQKLNVPFDMIDEFHKGISKDADGCSELAIKLDMLSWVPKLLESRYRKDIHAGCYALGVLVRAHAATGEWERFLNLFESIGKFENRFDHEYVYSEATSLQACYTHPSVLQHIPQKYHQRLRGALALPFFQNHFDPDQFEIEVRARDLQKAAD